MKKILVTILTLVFFVTFLSLLLARSTNPITCAFRLCNDAAPSYEQLQKREKVCHKSCFTKECVVTANEMLQLMDKTVDPCVDFYKYACGNYLKNNYPEDGEITSRLVEAKENVDNIISNLLYAIEDDSFTILKIFYHNCVHFASSEASYMSGIRKVLIKVGLTDWPNLSQYRRPLNNSTDGILSRFLALGQYSFISIKSFKRRRMQNNTNGDLFDVTLGMTPLMLNPQIYLKSNDSELDDFNKYKSFLFHLFQLFDYNGDINQQIKEIIELETSVARLLDQMSLVDEEGYEKKPKVDTRLETYEVNDSKWSKFLLMYFREINMKIDMNQIRLVRTNRRLIEDVKSLLESTPHRVLVNYLVLRLIKDNIEYASFIIKETLFEHMFSNGDDELFTNNKKNRNNFCNALTVKHFLMSTSAAYAEKYVGTDELTRLSDIYSALENLTINFISETDMYDDFLKDVLIEYISSLRTPRKQYKDICRKENVKPLEKYLSLSATDFIGIGIEIAATAQQMKIRMPYEYLSFQPCEMINPNFDAGTVQNFIIVGSGVLKMPIFSPKRLLAIDIASFGTILSHEMGHIIEFRLQKEEEKSELTKSKVDQNNKCFIDQYSKIKWNFIKEPFKANFTLNENMADNFGMYIGAKLFSILVSQKQQRFMTMDFNSSQLYFISSAQTFCEVVTPAGERTFFEYDSHSPSEFRIRETFKNLEAFAHSFHCPVGSPMNPHKKCLYRRFSEAQ